MLLWWLPLNWFLEGSENRSHDFVAVLVTNVGFFECFFYLIVAVAVLWLVATPLATLILDSAIDVRIGRKSGGPTGWQFAFS